MKAKRLTLTVLIVLLTMIALSAEAFPRFTATDLEGKSVNDGIFRKNTVTVVNFWFSTCQPCLSEIPDLDALDKELREKGGSVIGINADTLDNNTKMIKKAQEILKKKGAQYTNITFSSKSQLGKLVSSLTAYPTTYVVDSSGNIVGSPILGSINSAKMKAKLDSLIKEALGE